MRLFEYFKTERIRNIFSLVKNANFWDKIMCIIIIQQYVLDILSGVICAGELSNTPMRFQWAKRNAGRRRRTN